MFLLQPDCAVQSESEAVGENWGSFELPLDVSLHGTLVCGVLALATLAFWSVDVGFDGEENSRLFRAVADKPGLAAACADCPC